VIGAAAIFVALALLCVASYCLGRIHGEDSR
jgi:hypothetical protein